MPRARCDSCERLIDFVCLYCGPEAKLAEPIAGMVCVPVGEFDVRVEGEAPRRVRIESLTYLGESPVTLRDFQDEVRQGLSRSRSPVELGRELEAILARDDAADAPITRITSAAAQWYARRRVEHRAENGIMRLPSEGEWLVATALCADAYDCTLAQATPSEDPVLDVDTSHRSDLGCFYARGGEGEWCDGDRVRGAAWVPERQRLGSWSYTLPGDARNRNVGFRLAWSPRA